MSGTADFFGLKVPFLKHLGVKAEMAEGGRSRISLELRPELMNSFEVSHGGVIMTMLDVAMAVAARGQQKHPAGVMTVDMSLSFIRAGQGPHRRRRTPAARRQLAALLRRRGLRRQRRVDRQVAGHLQAARETRGKAE